MSRQVAIQTSNRKKSVPVKAVSVISVAFLLLLWTISTNLKWVDPLFLPTPQSVWAAFIELLKDGYK